jgi:hypothetical protein
MTSVMAVLSRTTCSMPVDEAGGITVESPCDPPSTSLAIGTVEGGPQ